MTHYNDKGQAAANPGNKVQISGKGRTEAEELVHAFARQADITIEDGFSIMNDRSGHGVCADKAAAFTAAVRAEYGSMDCLKTVCDSMAPAAPKVA